jgi:hypothetical protein
MLLIANGSEFSAPLENDKRNDDAHLAISVKVPKKPCFV